MDSSAVREAVDLVQRIVQIKAGPRGGRNSQADVQRHGAVVPCADGDAVTIQKLRQVVRVRPLEREADDRPFLGRIGRAEDSQTLDLTQDVVSVGDQRLAHGRPARRGRTASR